MSKTLQFKTFCFEMYKAEKGMTGIMAQELFEKHKVFECLDVFYEVLHTTVHRYIINIIDYISMHEQMYKYKQFLCFV